MGKTKTAFVSGVADEKLSSEEKYKQKQAKKKAEEEKKKVGGLGLRGGAKIKVIGAETTEEVSGKAELKKEKADISGESQEKVEKKVTKIHHRGSKYKNAKSKIDNTKRYNITDGIKLLKGLSYAKFDETFELHIIVKKQGLNLNITLPHNFGKTKKIEVANDATIEKLKKNKIDFDVLLATPEMMPKLVAYAKLLGPKGLMPNPKNGTVIKSEKDAEKFSADQKTIKTEKEQPVIHTSIGKMSMNETDVSENIQAVLDAVTKSNIEKIYLKLTMSPSVKLQI